ncbi:MAG: FkbM family methyltransferase [Anaerolineaceae bacterium]|nr:FkbM family methyltransferase [Anaerolineaceae bacterium]
MIPIIRKAKNGYKKWTTWIKSARSIPLIDILVKKKHFGSHYGGYTIATDNIDSNTIFYSFGVGKDITFEIETAKKYKCKFHLFDPTPGSVEWISAQKLPDHFSFYDYGISDQDGYITVFPPSSENRISHSIIKHKWTSDTALKFPVKSLSSIMQTLAHQHIDVLKMDIEGSEYAVLENLADSSIRPSQIIVEYHHHFPEIGVLRTYQSIQLLRSIGYKLFSYSPELEEFSFIHQSADMDSK